MPLVNAADFHERIEQELARAQRYCIYLSLLVLDFSELEDKNHGKESPISLPTNLSLHLTSLLRRSDLVAMPRGDQLVLLLVETPASGLAVVSDRVRSFVSDFLEQRPVELPIHSAVYPDTTGDFNRLLSSLQIRARAIN